MSKLLKNSYNLFKGSKSPGDPNQPCPNVPCMSQNCHLQPQPNQQLSYAQNYHHQEVVYNHHQTHMPVAMAPCPHLAPVIQSPTQQSVAYPVHDHLLNGASLNHRQQNMVLSSPIQHDSFSAIPQANHQLTVPTYQTNCNRVPQSAPIGTPSSRYPDNSYYINQESSMIQPQSQHHQQQLPYQQQLQQKPIFDEQRHRLLQHNQSNLQQIHQIPQPVSQQDSVSHLRRQQPSQQHQHYQNNNTINHYTNGDGGLKLETLCLIHEKENEELLKLAAELEDDLSKMAQELDALRRKTPDYKVRQYRI